MYIHCTKHICLRLGPPKLGNCRGVVFPSPNSALVYDGYELISVEFSRVSFARTKQMGYIEALKAIRRGPPEKRNSICVEKSGLPMEFNLFYLKFPEQYA